MKEAKRRASIRLLAATVLLPAFAGCEFRPGLANPPVSSVAPGAVESFLLDFARQMLAAFLF